MLVPLNNPHRVTVTYSVFWVPYMQIKLKKCILELFVRKPMYWITLLKCEFLFIFRAGSLTESHFL